MILLSSLLTENSLHEYWIYELAPKEEFAEGGAAMPHHAYHTKSKWIRRTRPGGVVELRGYHVPTTQIMPWRVLFNKKKWPVKEDATRYAVRWCVGKGMTLGKWVTEARTVFGNPASDSAPAKPTIVHFVKEQNEKGIKQAACGLLLNLAFHDYTKELKDITCKRCVAALTKAGVTGLPTIKRFGIESRKTTIAHIEWELKKLRDELQQAELAKNIRAGKKIGTKMGNLQRKLRDLKSEGITEAKGTKECPVCSSQMTPVGDGKHGEYWCGYCDKRYFFGNTNEAKRPYAGLVATRYNPKTKDFKSVYDGGPAEMSTEAGRWQTVCEKHGTVISHTTKQMALYHLADPDVSWCEQCQK